MPVALVLILAVLAVGPAAIFVRLAEVPPLVFASHRLLIAAVAIWLVVAARRGRDLVGLDRSQLLRCGLSGFFLALHFGSWISSLFLTSVASSVLLVSTQPIFAALIGRLVYRERVSAAALGAITVALAGTLVVAFGGAAGSAQAESLSFGNLLALVGALTMALYLLVGRRVRQKVPTLGYVAVTYSVAALVLLAWAATLGNSLWNLPLQSWIWIAAAALLASAVGHTLYNRALRDLPAHIVATTVLGEPLVASLLAVLVLAELPPGSTWIGAPAILGGVTWALWVARPRDADPGSPPLWGKGGPQS